MLLLMLPASPTDCHHHHHHFIVTNKRDRLLLPLPSPFLLQAEREGKRNGRPSAALAPLQAPRRPPLPPLKRKSRGWSTLHSDDIAYWFLRHLLDDQKGLQDFYKFDDIIVCSFAMVDQITEEKENALMPDISPSSAPQPFLPLLAPSPMATPFFNSSIPKLSGQCILNFSAVDSLISTTAVDCWTSFAPFLANVICCPQFQATLIILIGQSSKETGMLALDSTHANHCLSDIQQILGSQGANSDLQEICSVHPSNLSEGSCPVSDIDGFESVVDSSQLLTACGKVDPVNECCSKICQNAILEAARKLALRDGGLMTSMAINNTLIQHSSKIDSCRNIVLRWLSSRLDPSSAKQVLRRLSNCNVNGGFGISMYHQDLQKGWLGYPVSLFVPFISPKILQMFCPLDFPDTKGVAKNCGNEIKNDTACCHAMENYMDFVPESGCLLPSLPSDATFDPSSGISFTCDLNDNIAAPWPSASQASSSACNKLVYTLSVRIFQWFNLNFKRFGSVVLRTPHPLLIIHHCLLQHLHS
ncbi:hypothetical protein MUK42_10993 [Musa troglodytarum]|uniref:SPARK domain-containing protein n=1 Tax=Musa troglodytarum TaxID=320322 RepID=A0A9E7GTV4_9LILI|nr:hypothetical protein MUK42_10993 [Musa troglodytarum]